MKLKLTKLSLKVGDISFNQDLYDLTINLSISNSEVVKVSDETFVTYDDTDAGEGNKIPMDQATLLLVLANGGEMSEHIMYIRATDTIAGTAVSVDLPRREYFGPVVKDFQQWFEQDSEIWTEDPGTGVLFGTNPFSENAPDEFLKGSEMEIIRQLNISDYFILNETEKDAVVLSGWTKYVWNP